MKQRTCERIAKGVRNILNEYPLQHKAIIKIEIEDITNPYGGDSLLSAIATVKFPGDTGINLDVTTTYEGKILEYYGPTFIQQ
jgi:hypothetical protein